MSVKKGYDCIIIGGGISGLYVAYQLLKSGIGQGPGTKGRVLVLEKGERLGGRVFTFHNGMTVDAGAGRFSSSHTLVCELLRELGLWGKRVKNGTSVAHCYIKDGKSRMMTSIMDYDAMVLETSREYDGLHWSLDMVLDLVNRIRSHGSTLPNVGLVARLLAEGALRTRESLIQQNFLSFAKSVLTAGEIEFLVGSFGYYSELVLMNAHDCLKLMMELDPANGFYSLAGGLSQIIEELVKRIRDMGGEIVLRREVDGIRCLSGEQYVVSGVGPRGGEFSYSSNKVVCAVTKVDLMRWALFRPLAGFLSGLVSAPLCRVYARYPVGREGVWFKGLCKLTVNNELRMVIPISEREGVIMITYTDNRFADYWKGVFDRGGEAGLNRRIRVLIRAALGMEIPDAEEIQLFYWRRGVGYWGVGIDSAEVSQNIIQPFFTPLEIYNGTPLAKQSVPLEIQGQQLPINELNGTPPLVACPISNLHRCKRRLSVKGKKGGDDGHKGIFVCGENFSENYQQWMEGSLETGARVVERIRAIGTL